MEMAFDFKKNNFVNFETGKIQTRTGYDGNITIDKNAALNISINCSSIIPLIFFFCPGVKCRSNSSFISMFFSFQLFFFPKLTGIFYIQVYFLSRLLLQNTLNKTSFENKLLYLTKTTNSCSWLKILWLDSVRKVNFLKELFKRSLHQRENLIFKQIDRIFILWF